MKLEFMAANEDMLDPASPPLRVLIVEDEYQICRSISELLEYLGYKADFVQDPTKVREFLDRNQDIDIVLLDINLGFDLSGIDLLPIIKEKNKYLKMRSKCGQLKI